MKTRTSQSLLLAGFLAGGLAFQLPAGTADYRNLILSHGATAYYEFEETGGTNATDTAGGDRPGEIVGTVALGETSYGNLGKCFKFGEAESGVVIARAGDFNDEFDFGTNAFALELWFKAEVGSDRGEFFCLTESGKPSFMFVSNPYGVAQSNKVWAAINPGAGWWSDEPGSTTNGVWHHLVYTRDTNGVVRFFVDGLRKLNAVDNQDFSRINPVTIGINQVLQVPLNGWVDDVAIYPHTLYHWQVWEHFRAATNAPVTQPQLQVTRSGSDVTLAWPDTATGFRPTTKANLAAGAWNDLADTPVVEGGFKKVTLPATNAAQYFRLVWELPGQASNPSPTNNATDVETSAILSWTAGSSATSHRVYLGTDAYLDDGSHVANQTETTYDPGTLFAGVTYYWRIDEVNDAGITIGPVWKFKTKEDTSGGLLAWYKFDESSGTTAADSSGNANDGDLSGDASWVPTGGKINGALQSADAGQVYVPAALATAATYTSGKSTITAWVRPNDNDYNHIIWNGAGPYYFSCGSGEGGGKIRIMAKAPGNVWVTSNAGPIPADGSTWTHLALVSEVGVGMKLYINGELDTTYSNAGLVFFEASTPEVARQFNGRIDDMRIYDKALTDTEIWNVFNE